MLINPVNKLLIEESGKIVTAGYIKQILQQKPVKQRAFFG